jgi:polyisoprenyl-phosphate glycosyltransferase
MMTHEAHQSAPTPSASLVIPVYKNEASLPDLLLACRQLWDLRGQDIEVVFVVDGSPDACFSILRDELPRQPFSSQLCLHSRNFGSFAAIRTGFEHARGRALAVMAADLQEPIELAHQFFERLLADEADVTIGVREGRNDPWLSSLASRLFWATYRRVVMPEVPAGGVDMFGCSRQVCEQLLALEERNSSMIGQLFWVGFRRVHVPYVRRDRQHGVSAWTLSRKIRYLLDSVYAFSDLPIRALKWLGGSSIALALVATLIVVLSRLLGRIDVPGYTAIIVMVMFFGGLNALALGLLGEYVWRTFENTKRRPLAITAHALHFQGTATDTGRVLGDTVRRPA